MTPEHCPQVHGARVTAIGKSFGPGSVALRRIGPGMVDAGLPPTAILVLPGAVQGRVRRKRLRGARAHRGVHGGGPAGSVDRADPPPVRYRGLQIQAMNEYYAPRAP